MNLIMSSIWQDSRVLETGGASFIGSHLVDRLIELGANVLWLMI